MRMNKGAILASMVVIALASVFAGAGTMAYFTDVETSEKNTFEIGTLDVQIADSNEGWFDDKPVSASWTVSGWAPGQQFTTDEIRLKNVGNIDAQIVYVRFCELSNKDLAKKIKLVSIWDKSSSSITGDWYETKFTEDLANAWLKAWGVPWDKRKGYITLYDLVYVANNGGPSKKTGLYFYNVDAQGNPNLEGRPELAAGGTFATKATFELMYNTMNKFQGTSVTFRIDLIASQYHDKTDIVDNYITEPLGPLP